ncbi:unnamed protein product [Ilex paraguariensis]|uniref:Glycine-rich protein n=1 Tax=Ilex paraguariensis TaxID=185542 RepID=A0ABC8S4D3_9AQUA
MTKPNYINGVRKTQSNPFWEWKGINGKKRMNGDKGLSVTGFLQENGRKMEEAVLGPGGGAGVGCGIGVGLGLVGGVGYGGWPWNQLRMVFGVGMGCGVGVGFGYGQGLGLGFSLDTLRSHLSNSKPKSDSKDWFIIHH